MNFCTTPLWGVGGEVVCLHGIVLATEFSSLSDACTAHNDALVFHQKRNRRQKRADFGVGQRLGHT